ncbi:hypothetical protein B5566_02710 [Mycobacterium sp. MHSD3]|nr:hypothetical protein B5566_02710 [Mycobacterium sp. MHSD3]
MPQVQIRSRNILTALVGPGADKVMSARKLAEHSNIHHSYVDHLIAGRRDSVSVDVGRRMAAALGVKMGVLFQPPLSNVRQRNNKRSVER